MPPCFTSGPERRHTLRSVAPNPTLTVGRMNNRAVFLDAEGCRAAGLQRKAGGWRAAGGQPASTPPQAAAGLLVQQPWHLPRVYRTTSKHWINRTELRSVPTSGSGFTVRARSARQPDSACADLRLVLHSDSSHNPQQEPTEVSHSNPFCPVILLLRLYKFPQCGINKVILLLMLSFKPSTITMAQKCGYFAHLLIYFYTVN